MATQPVFEAPVSVEEYLSTVYEHDCEYVDGAIEERALGEFEHSWLQLFMGSIFVSHRTEWGVIALTEQRVQTQRNHFRVPDLTVLRSGAWNWPAAVNSPSLSPRFILFLRNSSPNWIEYNLKLSIL